MQVEWSPHDPSIIATSSYDRRIHIWDLDMIGAEITEDEKEQGPAELLFIHAGHTANMSDFCFDPCHNFRLMSVAEDHILQLWQIADYISNYNGAIENEIEKENASINASSPPFNLIDIDKDPKQSKGKEKEIKKDNKKDSKKSMVKDK
ncbi:MAG: putative WD domain, G-beta repeat protein [Streblomastix strix]|uniref:Putative WD domain, G-beta repeat protein n=1 Tax=Streblomastix strix TaxID=222440 RepID=A0A5J4WAJ6_9EUKA|nr:MAG: putative WD domain, G-beta repeat protein [Streblomastix strix]